MAAVMMRCYSRSHCSLFSPVVMLYVRSKLTVALPDAERHVGKGENEDETEEEDGSLHLLAGVAHVAVYDVRLLDGSRVLMHFTDEAFRTSVVPIRATPTARRRHRRLRARCDAAWPTRRPNGMTLRKGVLRMTPDGRGPMGSACRPPLRALVQEDAQLHTAALRLGQFGAGMSEHQQRAKSESASHLHDRKVHPPGRWKRCILPALSDSSAAWRLQTRVLGRRSTRSTRDRAANGLRCLFLGHAHPRRRRRTKTKTKGTKNK